MFLKIQIVVLSNAYAGNANCYCLLQAHIIKMKILLWGRTKCSGMFVIICPPYDALYFVM